MKLVDKKRAWQTFDLENGKQFKVCGFKNAEIIQELVEELYARIAELETYDKGSVTEEYDYSQVYEQNIADMYKNDRHKFYQDTKELEDGTKIYAFSTGETRTLKRNRKKWRSDKEGHFLIDQEGNTLNLQLEKEIWKEDHVERGCKAFDEILEEKITKKVENIDVDTWNKVKQDLENLPSEIQNTGKEYKKKNIKTSGYLKDLDEKIVYEIPFLDLRVYSSNMVIIGNTRTMIDYNYNYNHLKEAIDKNNEKDLKNILGYIHKNNGLGIQLDNVIDVPAKKVLEVKENNVKAKNKEKETIEEPKNPWLRMAFNPSDYEDNDEEDLSHKEVWKDDLRKRNEKLNLTPQQRKEQSEKKKDLLRMALHNPNQKAV